MKALLLVLLVLLSASVAQAEDWTTSDGTVYKDVQVVRVEDDAITILYKDGGALVPIFKLPSALQKRFDYDPVKAKAAADIRAKADADNAKRLQAEIDATTKAKHDQQIRDAGGAVSK